jgi:uncharacterized protein
MDFEWDPDKAEANASNHNVTFEEAQTVFDDPLSVIYQDPMHSAEEERFLIIGESFAQRMIIVAFVEHGDSIRIISARIATRSERKEYEENQ